MILLPAIDLKGGACVRLFQGDFDTAHTVADSAQKTAQSFLDAGSEWIHVVDLDGAKSGTMENQARVDEILSVGLKVELGGGIRDRGGIERWLARGVSRVVLGSAALRDAALVKEAALAYGAALAVGVDAKDGFVTADGWLTRSERGYIDFAKEMEQLGVQTLIFTNIARDGMLQGPDLEQLSALMAAVSCGVIASGGVKDAGDIKALVSAGAAGAIVGKAIYAGTLNLKEALAIAKEGAPC